VDGKFSIEELASDPANGLTRFSATFGHHCDGDSAALGGVVNYAATGSSDAAMLARLGYCGDKR